MGFFSAFRFLTVLPLPLGRDSGPEEVGRSVGWFPVVGLVLGLILAGLSWLLARIWPASVSNALLLVTLAAMTGGMHLDGWIDTCDGLAGGRTPEQRWGIMRDSRVGAYGVIGAVLLLLVETASLGALLASSSLWALVLVPVLGRGAAACCIYAFPYARPKGLGRAFKDQATWKRAAVAATFSVALSALLLGLTGVIVALGVAIVTAGLAAFLARKLSGLTGDSYGAIIEIGQAAAMLLIVALRGLRLG